jgi:threonine aldolase
MIDLRSDTVTRPTEAMLAAMQEASLGDDSRDGDETVRRLEARAAEMTGKEAGVFVPSGTMSNLVAILAHADRGGEVIGEATSHIFNSELGGVANLAGMFPRMLPGRRGAMDLDALAERIRPAITPTKAGTALVCLETTHNAAGGAVLPLPYMAEVAALARGHGVPVHLDGARLFNAAVALKVPAAELGKHVDSVGFCVSKGLSAPVGSVLCGSAAFVERARGFRRMVGGNLRQAGPLAAAGLLGLETMVERLAEDHRTAKRLAEGLHKLEASLVDPAHVETNLVRVDVAASGRPAAEWSAELKKRGVLVNPCAKFALRFVTHRHIGNAEVDQALQAVAEVRRQSAGAAR